MKSIAYRRVNLGLSGDVILTVLVVVGFVSLFTVPPGALALGDYALLALANLIYLLNGIFGWRHWDRTRTPDRGAGLLRQPVRPQHVHRLLELSEHLVAPVAPGQPEHRAAPALDCGRLPDVDGLVPAAPAAAGSADCGGLIQPEGATLGIVLEAMFDFWMALVFILLFSELLVRERQARAALDEAHTRLSQYAVQAEDLATAQERARLAREVHDSLGHHLTAIHVHLEAARTLMESQPSLATEALRRAQALTQEGLSEVRRSVAALRASPLEDRSLPEALSALVETCCAAGIAADLRVIGEPRRLPTPVKAALFRTAQEGLTNVRKHAQARRADVALDYTDAAVVQLAVQDDGVGAADPSGGFGLLGVRERVQLLGGQVRVRTAPGQGFPLEVEVPG